MLFRACIVAFAALVRRDKMVLGPEALCAGQDAACAALGEGWQQVMAAADADAARFLQAIGLQTVPRSEAGCLELCRATAAFVETEDGGSWQLPPSKSVICSDESSCVEVGAVDGKDLANATEEAASLLKVETVDEARQSKAKTLRYTPQELALSLLALFDIHVARAMPEDFAPQEALVETLGAAPFAPEFGDGVRKHRYQLYAQYAAKAASLLRTAILRMWRNPSPIRHWLGADIDRQRSGDMDDVREKFQGMLKTVLNLKIMKADEDSCGETGVALVKVRLNSESEWVGSETVNVVIRGEMMTPRVYKVNDDTLIGNDLQVGDNVKCRNDGQTYTITHMNKGSSLVKFNKNPQAVKAVFVKEGKYVVHVCERFWGYWMGPTVRTEALLKEAAHHNGALEVQLSDGSPAKGKEGCLALVEEKGNDLGGALANADCYLRAIMVLAQDKI